jgi:hypothetical protein
MRKHGKPKIEGYKEELVRLQETSYSFQEKNKKTPLLGTAHDVDLDTNATLDKSLVLLVQ